MEIRNDNEIHSLLNEIGQKIAVVRQIASRNADVSICRYWIDGVTGNLKQTYDFTKPNLELTFENGKLVSAKVLK